MEAQTSSPWMSYPLPQFAPLAGNAFVDVCIVGAGIAGLTTAYLLCRKGSRVMVIDDGPIGGGMTCRTTAHLMSVIDDRFHEVERLHGTDAARIAAQSHAAAIEAIEAIVAQESIDCDFTRLDGYLFVPPGGDAEELEREYEASRRCGVTNVAWADRAPMKGHDSGRCLRFPRQGQFHPLKYLAGLARAIVREGGSIHCDVHAAEIENGKCVRAADGQRIGCRSVVIATNAPIDDRVAMHPKQAPYMTYVVAARVPPNTIESALLWDTADPYHYVRLDKPDGELLLVGGEDHKTGQADDPERRFHDLESWMYERYPKAREVVHRWSGQCMQTQDFLAFAGRNPGQENVYIATGDSGMGMTHSTIAGIVITDLIHGAQTAWSELYDPARVNLKAAPNFARENANVVWQYTDWITGGEVESAEKIRAGEGAVVRRGAEKIAIYRDDAGALHEMSAKCTHLGCQVHWNYVEKTWDCKCHGSRFDARGTVISGPANSNLPPADEDVLRPAMR